MPPLRSFAAFATAAQPVAAPEPERRPQPARRAPLRIVAPPDPEAGARWRRRVVAGALAGLACAGLFAIVGIRVLLAQAQGPVDTLESEVTAAQAENQRLRLDVARLESPARIVNEAQSRLGMVPPAGVVYLPPLAPQPTQAQPTQAQPAQAQPTQTQPTQAQPTQAQPTQEQPTQEQPTQAEQTQPTQEQPTQAEPSQAPLLQPAG